MKWSETASLAIVALTFCFVVFTLSRCEVADGNASKARDVQTAQIEAAKDHALREDIIRAARGEK